jgi:hypothetical protein
MGSSSKKISNLNSLNREILKLETKANNIGQKLDNKFDYLQENYLTLIKKSIFRSNATGAAGVGIVSAIVSSLIGNERLREALSKAASPLADKAAGWIENLITWMSKKEKE